MKNIPIIGGPLDGSMTDYEGKFLDAYLPPIGASPEWPVPSENECIRTQYERRRIGQDWGAIQLEGTIYLWRGYKGDPVAAAFAALIARNMTRPQPGGGRI